MFQIGKTIVSDEVLENEFVCNLTACKGQCCIDGDAGAPLSKEETTILEEIYPKIKSYLRPEGIAVIEEQGTWVVGEDGEHETPLIEGRECAYVIFDKDTALCGIEQAYNEGLVQWKKPISCHLYPIRIKEYSQFSAVNYNRWYICDDACALGKELEVPVYKFLKEPLIRKFGEDWYAELETVALEWKKQSPNK
ncbi:DUF3109 family protein [Flavobacterium sp. xlx-214]|uniref:DUF3109 family protein n=1 Tax=unclassified Flavobacterium TaxID=196869 RepID=UPI0013CF90AE|nr:MULTISPECIES: DUF3109 family protein [unclassified Flavobacterium]MBA5792196.1 DUF3109 family protein [Flavobacterium sp. xlx-221]QMI84439.1 DUF3109 family protein [Flavobacterium sp. xlx-214]